MEQISGNEKPTEVIRETDEAFIVNINYKYPESEPVVFANHLVVQHDPHEFILSFYQLIPPLSLPGPEALRKRLEEADGLHARCVARIAISKDRMPGFVSALAGNLEKQKEKTQKHQDSTSHEDKQHDSTPRDT